MRPNRNCYLATNVVICVFLIAAAGAAPSKDTNQVTEQIKIKPTEPVQQKSPVKLALKFSPQAMTTYRLVRGNDRSVKWEGPAESKPKSFTGGHTGNRMEMSFTQKIQSVDDKGNAVAQITITALKYITRVKDKVTLDFDSTRKEDLINPLGKLIGHSYTVVLTPFGDILRISGVDDTKAAIAGSTPVHKLATNLLSDKGIKDRHTITALPDANDSPIHPGEGWSSVKSYFFGMMGTKSYEKIYTLEEVRDIKNHKMAIARMKGVPSPEEAKEFHKEQGTSLYSQVFDNTYEFTGELIFDLTSGQVVESREEFLVEWFVVDPDLEDYKQPSAFRMATGCVTSIKRVE